MADGIVRRSRRMRLFLGLALRAEAAERGLEHGRPAAAPRECPEREHAVAPRARRGGGHATLQEARARGVARPLARGADREPHHVRERALAVRARTDARGRRGRGRRREGRGRRARATRSGHHDPEQENSPAHAPIFSHPCGDARTLLSPARRPKNPPLTREEDLLARGRRVQRPLCPARAETPSPAAPMPRSPGDAETQPAVRADLHGVRFRIRARGARSQKRA